MPAPVLVWFRHDLRLADHPALSWAAARGPVVPVYLDAPEEQGEWPLGGATRWWLHRSLSALDGALHAQGLRLILRRGPTLDRLTELVAETGARTVVWSRRYEPAAREQDAQVAEALRADGVAVETFNAALLHEPWEVATGGGRPYQVFSAFRRRCLTRPVAEPLAAPALTGPAGWPASEPLDSLEYDVDQPNRDGLTEAWTPGEAAARQALAAWTTGGLSRYEQDRDRVDRDGTSRLSPYLRFGELSPRQVRAAVAESGVGEAARAKFLAELGWREFAYHLLWHHPRTPAEPLRPEFREFAWRRDDAAFRTWREGRTGYPLVDAGMRQLTATGWLPNRVRMVAASFLVKDLGLPWQDGARHFWDTLVDADLANNTLGWQWTAGCGADAAPYWRVLNPTRQAARFDPDGAYARRWLPELGGPAYPAPMVDHEAARRTAKNEGRHPIFSLTTSLMRK